jgi:hypothetical protein
MNCRTVQNFGFLVLFLLSCAVLTASAQDKNQTSADEDFTLNITEERAVETNYERSKAVAIGDAETSLSVRVGMSVSAQTINITLRGVTGNGRFRASLEKIQKIQNSRLLKIQDSKFKIQD